MRISQKCYCVSGLTYLNYFSVNAGFVIGDDVTVIINSGYNIEAAQTIYGYAQAAAPNNKVSYIINLSGEYEYTFGNSFFIKHGAKVIAHSKNILKEQELLRYVARSNKEIKEEDRKRNREAFIYFDGVIPFKPDVAVEADTVLPLKGIDLEIYTAPGYRENNLMVYEKQGKVLYTADAIYTRYLPTLEQGNRVHLQKWIETLERIEELKPEVLIPGHGQVLKGEDIYKEIIRHKEILVRSI